VERRRSDRAEDRPSGRATSEPRRLAKAVVASSAATCCRVCGGCDVREDQVMDRGFWRLAHCGRCDHRWTERVGDAFSPLVRRAPAMARRAGGA
jgi:hypothetical protein